LGRACFLKLESIFSFMSKNVYLSRIHYPKGCLDARKPDHDKQIQDIDACHESGLDLTTLGGFSGLNNLICAVTKDDSNSNLISDPSYLPLRSQQNNTLYNLTANEAAVLLQNVIVHGDVAAKLHFISLWTLRDAAPDYAWLLIGTFLFLFALSCCCCVCITGCCDSMHAQRKTKPHRTL